MYNKEQAKQLVEGYKALKQSFGSRDDTFEWWAANASHQELGVYGIDTNKKVASFRATDDTPSTHFYPGLCYIDFGGDGQKHDVVDRVMENSGKEFLEAIEFILSISTNFDLASVQSESFSNTQERKQEKKKPYNTAYLQKAVRNKSIFAARYTEVAKGLFRHCSATEQKFAEGLLSIGFIPQDEFQEDDRIFIPEFDSNRIAYGSYRYNRNPGFYDNGEQRAKGLLRKNAQRVLFGAHLLSKYGKDVILAEGHSDSVVNIAKALANVSSGSSTKKLGENLKLLAGKHIHIFHDLDFAGALGAFNKALEIIEWNKAHPEPENQIEFTIYWWAEWFVSEKLAKKIISGKLEPADPAYGLRIPIKKGHACVNVSIIRQFLVNQAKKKGMKAFPKALDPNNWKLLSKKALKEGYDFIDFHGDHMTSPNYERFLAKFKFS